MKTMNNHGQLGFKWLGRIALVMYSYDENEPKKKIDRLEPENAEMLMDSLSD